jgi:hypothetical protein
MPGSREETEPLGAETGRNFVVLARRRSGTGLPPGSMLILVGLLEGLGGVSLFA